MDRLIQDLRFALRALITRRGFSVIAIATLALGIGITTAIFSVVNGILLRPLPFRDSERIMTVWQTRSKDPQTGGSLSHPAYLDIRAQSKSFESLAEYSSGTATLTGDGPATVVPQATVTPGFFHVMGEELALGRDFTDAEDAPNGPKLVIASYDFWETHLGSRRDVIGSTIGLNGEPYRVIGVAPKGFHYPEESQLWALPHNDDTKCGRGCVYMAAVGRLAPGVTMEAAQKEMATLADRFAQLYPKSNAGTTLRLNSLQNSITGDVRPALFILLAAVGMVLLIACANVANLLLVRGATRRAELAVRSVLGATRRRILLQLMTENLVLAGAAGVAGTALASWAVDALRTLAPASIPRTGDVGLDATTTLFALALVVVTALLFGLAPALQLSRESLSSSIRESGRGSDGSPRRLTRSAILVAEVALSIMLLLGAGLLLRSFTQLAHVQLGFDGTNVTTFTVSLPGARYPTPDSHVQAMEQIKANIAAIPGVTEVGTAIGVPLGPINFFTSFRRMDLPEPEPNQEPSAAFRVIDQDYLHTMRIPIVRGRDFSASDRHDAEPVALITDATAKKYFAGTDPIGKRIHVGVGMGYENTDVERTIVGIVQDVRSSDLKDGVDPAVYVPAAQSGADFTSFVVRSRGSGDVVNAARTAVHAFDNDIALEYDATMDALVADQLAAPRFYLALISLFAVLAALLAAVGIYGVVSYLVANRTREIGIRMALGAQRERVVKLIVWQGLRPALIGVVIGLAGATMAVKVMSSLLYGVAPHDLGTFAAVTALLIAIVLVACAIPAWRASRIPPGAALRTE